MRFFVDIVEDAGRLGFPAPLLTLAALYGHKESARTLEALVVAGGGGHETRSGVPNALWLIPVPSASRDNEDVLELRFEHVPFYVHAISEHDHWLLLVLTAAALEVLTISRAPAPSLQHRYSLAVPAPCCRLGRDRGAESVATATRRATEPDGRLRWRWASVAGPWLAAVYEDHDPRIWLLHWPSACRYAALDPSASSERARLLHEVHRNILLPCGFVYGAEDGDTPLWAQMRCAGVERFCSGAFTSDASWLALTCTATRHRSRLQISLTSADESKEINDAREHRDEHSVDARPGLVLVWLRSRLGDPGICPQTGLACNTHAADESNAIFLDMPLNNQVRRPARRPVRAPTPGPCVFLGTKALITTVVNSDGTTVASLWRHAASAQGPWSQHSWSLWRSWRLVERQPVTALSVFTGSASSSPNEWPGVLGVAVANGTLQSYIVRPTRGCTTRAPLLCTSWLRHHHRRGWRRAPATNSALPSKAFDLVHDLPTSALVVVPWIDEQAPSDAGTDNRLHASTEWLLCSASPDGTLVWIKLRQALAWTLVERALGFLFLYLVAICATRVLLFQ